MPAQIERALITGGTGFIGSALTRRLLERNVAVDILTRDRQRVARQFSGKAAGIESPDELTPERAPDVIINLAGKNLGSQRWNEHARGEFVRSRVETTRKIIEYIERARKKPQLLISASAIGYYGARGDEFVDETTASGDEYQSDLCRRWEDAANAAIGYDVRVCIPRLGVVIGPGGGALAEVMPLFRFGLGAVIGSGNQWVSWIALEDLLNMFDAFMADESLAGCFNATAPKPVTNREFSRTLAKVLRRPVLMRIPAPVYRLMFGGVAHLHLTGQRVVPQRLIDAGFEFRCREFEHALTAALKTSA
jgi:uncharacterized protein (TIGR01777 family)